MKQDSQLAINGGPKTKTTPYHTENRFTHNERKYLEEALQSNNLFYEKGKWVHEACNKMKDYTGLPYAVACSSGSAAIHMALVAAGVGQGDEVVVTPNTDSGSVLGALAEGAVPVFCDYNDSLQPGAKTIQACLTTHTKAVVVVHLAGAPAPIEEIIDLCEPMGIAVIEDCAQAWGTRLNGKRVGTFGLAGCFSLNDFKHISAGDGGFVVLKDESLYRRVANFGDKFYDRFWDGSMRQAHFGMNYRMSELQGAVGCAQLEKVDTVTDRSHRLGEMLREHLKDVPGVRLMRNIEGGYSTYWWLGGFVDPSLVPAGRDAVVEAFQAEGLCAATYGKYDLIQSPLFQKRLMRPWLENGRAMYPFVQPGGREYDYSIKKTPFHKQALETGFILLINSYQSDRDMMETAQGIRKVMAEMANAKRESAPATV